MLLLGVDTALFSCSAAVFDGAGVLSKRQIAIEKGHAEHLPPMVVEVLREAGVFARDLERVGVVVGPGGFAGVRVGVAFARGLCIGTKATAVGVTSLEALAKGAPGAAGLIAAVVNAHRGEVYAAVYDSSGRTALEPFVAAPEVALARIKSCGARLAVGDGVALVDPQAEQLADLGAPSIDPVVVARIAAAREPSGSPAPLYLRNPDAKPGAPSPFAALLMKEGEF